VSGWTLPAALSSALFALVVAYVAGHLVQALARVIHLILARFSLDIGTAPDPAELTARRDEAFLLCRRALIQQKAGSYAEQFEGMYALMRGLATVAGLSATYHLGWASGRAIPGEGMTCLGWGLVGLSVVAAFAVLGSSFKTASSLAASDIAVLVVVASGSLFAARQFHQAYQYFGDQFAATVYRDFYVLNQMATSERRS
jgi:hypothetical protein